MRVVVIPFDHRLTVVCVQTMRKGQDRVDLVRHRGNQIAQELGRPSPGASTCSPDLDEPCAWAQFPGTNSDGLCLARPPSPPLAHVKPAISGMHACPAKQQSSAPSCRSSSAAPSRSGSSRRGLTRTPRQRRAGRKRRTLGRRNKGLNQMEMPGCVIRPNPNLQTTGGAIWTARVLGITAIQKQSFHS